MSHVQVHFKCKNLFPESDNFFFPEAGLLGRGCDLACTLGLEPQTQNLNLSSFGEGLSVWRKNYQCRWKNGSTFLRRKSTTIKSCFYYTMKLYRDKECATPY